jgi:hypothetical protein
VGWHQIKKLLHSKKKKKKKKKITRKKGQPTEWEKSLSAIHWIKDEYIESKSSKKLNTKRTNNQIKMAV